MMEQSPNTPTDSLTSTVPTASDAPTQVVTEFDSHPFTFHGLGGEFFRIWIVNIVLTILTLGIYAAWAKVRTHQYFYGNMQVAGGSFQYLANPVTILKGRIVAVVLFVAYFFLSQQFPVETMVVSIPLFLFLSPWIINRSLRFNMRNTAFRNIRFDFTGTYWSAFCNFVLGYLAVLVSFGIAFPWWIRQLNKYLVNNCKYGDAPFEAKLDVGEYYITFLMAMLITTVLYIGLFVLGGLSFAGATFDAPAVATIGTGITVLAGIVGFTFVKAFVNARLGNLLFNNTKLKENKFTSELDAKALTKLYLVNAFLIVVTLGFAIPWVICNLVRYRADTLVLQGNDLDSFVAAQIDAGNAIGEEIGDVFDIELGL